MSNQLRLDPAQLTDVGRKRPHNEDNMAYVIPKDPVIMGKQGALFIVADGMGGHAAGEVASEIAVDTVSNVYYQEDSDETPALLLKAIKRANALIYQRAAENMLRSGMGTTCVATIIRGSIAYFANVGDSRAYFIRNGHIRRVSQDHSWVEEQVRAGLLSEEQARSHAQRNVITRCLGTQSDVEVDIFYEKLQVGDTILLCSDGLSGLVSDEELCAIVQQYPPQESVYHLVERANENGGMDNITVIVVRVQEVGIDPPGTHFPLSGGETTADEDTLSLSMLPGRPLAMPGMASADRSIPTSPLHYTSGPLSMNGTNGTGVSSFVSQKRSQNRLFYPTLAFFILLVVSLVTGSFYYLLLRNNNTVDVDASLRDARNSIDFARAEVTGNPTDAFQKLASAHSNLLKLRSITRTASQDTTFKDVQNVYLTTFQEAITTYNTQSLITQLPCTTTISSKVSTDSTDTRATSIAALQDTKSTQFYVLGENAMLYQLSTQKSLINPFKLDGTILKIVSDGSRLLALTANSTTNPTSYSLHLLLPDPAGLGMLKDSNAATIDPKITSDSNTPPSITAWGSDVFVVITSATNQNTLTILDYPVEKNALNNKPSKTQISVTAGIAGVAAFPNKQLFLLDESGSIFSLNLMNSNPTPNATPVVLTKAIASPLPVSVSDVNVNTAVPQVTTSPNFLSFPRANLIVVGDGFDANSPARLYIVDGVNHRILALRSANTVSPSTTTPVKSATPAKSSSPTTGGGVAPTTSPTMELLQQYTSTHILFSVKSIVADPKVAQIDLLVQDSQAMLNLVSLNVAQGATCTPAP